MAVGGADGGRDRRFAGIVDRCVHRDVDNGPLSSLSTRAEALPVIVVAGEVLVDLVVRADGVVDSRLGGGPYNTARTLARLGVATTFFGGLADDRFGRQLRGALETEGVAIGVPGPSAAPTTLALVDLDQAGVASYAFYLDGTAAANVDYPPLATAFAAILAEARATAVHVGTLGLVMEPIGSAVERLVLADVPPDALVMLDP